MSENIEWTWEIASDEHEVHDLLCASDAHHATQHAPAPTRNSATTRQHVLSGAVHALRYNGLLVGMFTLTETPPRGLHVEAFPHASRPAYLQRLAVHPNWIERDALVGVRCVRRACEIAWERQADVLRSEANPDLDHVCRLLRILGFTQVGPILEEDGRRKVFLQRVLLPG